MVEFLLIFRFIERFPVVIVWFIHKSIFIREEHQIYASFMLSLKRVKKNTHDINAGETEGNRNPMKIVGCSGNDGYKDKGEDEY